MDSAEAGDFGNAFTDIIILKLTVMALVITCFAALFVTAALVYGERKQKRKEETDLAFKRNVTREYREVLSEMYREGDRIELQYLGMDDPMLSKGDRGTVFTVDSLCTVHVMWDNGCQIGLIPGEDLFENLSAAQRIYSREKENVKEEFEKE